MRKIMMAALFSVVSLSACAVDDPQQADTAGNSTAGDTVMDTAGDQGQQMDPVVAQPTPTPGQRDLSAHGIDGQTLEPVLEIEAMPCDANADCPTNVCDLEKHTCREYPF